MVKKLLAIIALFLLPLVASASILGTQQGGTGSSSPSGILFGNNNATPLSTLTIGSNLTLTGSTLSATGGGGSSTFGTTSLSAVAPLQYSQSPLAQFSITQAGVSTNGYLSSIDWNTFNNKQPSGTYVTAVSVASSNGFAGSSSGGATPSLTLSTTITGLLKGNGTAISAAANGTDFTLLTANTCGAGQFFNSATAAGVLGCGTPAGTTYTGTYPIIVTGSVISSGFGTTTTIGVGNNLSLYTNNAGVIVGVATSSTSFSIGGNAGTATALQTGRTISITGDLAYTSPSFDGSGNVTAAGTLATVNTNVGSFTNANITVNGKGLVTAAANGTVADTFAWPFTPGTFGSGIVTSATSTIIVDYPGLVTATSTIGALTASSSITNQSVKSALVLNGSGGLEGAYGGASACTNQFVTAISAVGGTTCVSINNAQWSGTQLSIANGGTNATSFTTTGNSVYYNGTALLTAPLTSAVTTPYASTTVLSASGSIFDTALGTAAGTFAAFDPSGKLIATTTPINTGGSTEGVNWATTGVLSGTPTYSNGTLGVGATLTEIGTGALSVDGNAPASGDRVLVKNQASAFQNGIYVVTATGSGIASYILTRSTDYNSNTEITPGLTTYVVSGTANLDTTWAVSFTPPLTMGTTNLAYTKVSGGGAAVTSVSNSDSTITFSPTTGAVVGSLNLGNSNIWTALQVFSNASSTQLTSGTNTFYVNGSGGITGKDVASGNSGILSPIRNATFQTGTTTTWTASTTGSGYSPFVTTTYAGTIEDARCTPYIGASAGSFLGVNVIVNGSNATPSYFVASSTVGIEHFTSGNTFSAGQTILFNFGTTTTATATSISCTIDVIQTT